MTELTSCPACDSANVAEIYRLDAIPVLPSGKMRSILNRIES